MILGVYLKMIIRFLFILFSMLFISGWMWGINPDTEKWVNAEVKVLTKQAKNLDPEVLKQSLLAYQKARNNGLDNKELLTIIDYDKYSYDRRFFVIDMRHNKILFNTWVSHGKNSGDLKAISFSNQPGSLKSSLGLLVTDNEPYVGGQGYSLRLKGLERGINDNAYMRDIVVHGAWYVGSEALKRNGSIGRSWGCPAVSDKLVHPIIDTIKGNTLVFVYSHEYDWLSRSFFV